MVGFVLLIGCGIFLSRYHYDRGRCLRISSRVHGLLIHFVGGLLDISVGLPRAWFFSSPRKCLRNPSARPPGFGSAINASCRQPKHFTSCGAPREINGILPVASPGASGSCGFRPYCFSLMARWMRPTARWKPGRRRI